MKLNFSNVEELVFLDDQLHRILPTHFAGLFESWKLGKRVPALRQLARTSVLDFLNQVDDDIIKILEKYYEEKITVEKLSYSIVKNIKISINEDICKILCEIDGFPYYTIWRDDQYLYISLWR